MKIPAKDLKPGMVVRANVRGQEYFVVSVTHIPPVASVRWVPVERMQYADIHHQTQLTVVREK